MNNKNDLLKELQEIKDKGLRTSDILKYFVEDTVDRFNELHRWKTDDFPYFKELLKSLKEIHGKKKVKTTEKCPLLKVEMEKGM
ncbi:hypothetical protein [Peribacillus sp. NPDC097895]|uniref:hypothetical protein n=1 Tax=Peribacillus sp. NPDC097895 TaxID=3390619 RepID=UPI003CFC8708